MKSTWMFVAICCVSTTVFAASKPVFTVNALVPAPAQIARNTTDFAVYTVTNNTTQTRTLRMQQVPGIQQIVTTNTSCTVPFTLAPGASCFLDLHITGSDLPNHVLRGPVICQEASNSPAPNPFLCAQPSLKDSFHITQTASQLTTGNTWISALIAQDAPPSDIATYVRQMQALAPAAEQIHLRLVPILNPTVGPQSTPAYYTTYQFYVALINALYTAYSDNASFFVGYHPDNSKGSESYWGCNDQDWQCVLNDSLIVMNNINALQTPSFKSFSIEQSYLEPVDVPTLQAVKACLNPTVAAPGAVCPVATIASPSVTYGDVLPSYGESDIYGPTVLDYGYPQYYNLVETINSHASVLISSDPNSYFPPDSAANCLGDTATFPYNVIDANLSGKKIPKTGPVPPLIPCFTPNVQPDPYPNPANDVFTYQNQANPNLAAAYDAYLMTQLPPISQTIDTNGATVYITFSGEPQFLGSTGWTLDKINAFNQQLNTNFTVLNQLIPGIVPPGVDTSAIKYAIWNYTAILANNP